MQPEPYTNPDTYATTGGSTPGIERGCGRRKKGGVYLETPTSPDGAPIDAFLLEPPTPYDAECNVGVVLVDVVGQDGATVTHVVDFVGREHYPWPADFIEEAARYGVSRRIPATLDVSRLTDRSRLVVVHARAILADAAVADRATRVQAQHTIDAAYERCAAYATARHQHNDGATERHSIDQTACSRRHWWHAEPTTDGTDTRGVPMRRFTAAVTYPVSLTPAGYADVFEERAETATPRWASGVVAVFPLGRITVIRDPSAPGTTDALARRMSGLTHVPVGIAES